MEPWPSIAALAVVCLLLAIEVARLHGARLVAAYRSRARTRRALRGERDAERLLRTLGYRVEARQAEGAWAPTIDGVPAPVRLRADLLLRRGGRRYLAEVKTGTVAPSLDSAATRRQLLEYRMAFDVDGVLLVVPERGAVHAVEFPGLDGAAAGRAAGTVARVFLRGLLVGAILVLALQQIAPG